MPPIYYCLPDLSSVPGSAGKFKWWTSPPDVTQLQYFPDNPNWLGAFSLSEGSGADRDMQFRALKGTVDATQYLFLSWMIRVSDLNAAIDRVNCVLGDGTNYIAFQVKLNSSSMTVAGTQDAGAYTYKIFNCSVSGGGIAQVNPFLTTDGATLETTGRMWIDVVSPGRNIATKWAFQVAIPLGAAWGPTSLTIPTAGPFKIWYEVVASAPASTAVPYAMQPPAGSGLSPVFTSSSLNAVPAGLTVGHLMDMSTGATDCITAVTIAYSGIGVRNVDSINDPARPSPYTIRLDLGQAYPPNMASGAGPLYNTLHNPNVTLTQYQNQFYAQPDVSSLSTPALKNSVRARFSLANWGSQYALPTASSWRPVPGGEDVHYDDTQSEARFVWPLPVPPGTSADSYTTTLVRNINKYLNATGKGTPMPSDAQSPHQCMLVELSSTNPNVIFTRSSLYVNMNITQASIARAPARISVEGLTPIGSQPRDVYLYLQTFNMPKVVNPDQQPSTDAAGATRKLATSVSHGGTKPLQYEVEDIAAIYPTYIVHVYHDTGKKMTLEDGSQVPILHPQTAFGYFVQHDGNLVGWETRLYGAEKLADNFYRLKVPNNGASYVETGIQARESASDTPLPPDDQTTPQTKCRKLVEWLRTKGIIGKILAFFVLLICKLIGQ